MLADVLSVVTVPCSMLGDTAMLNALSSNSATMVTSMLGIAIAPAIGSGGWQTVIDSIFEPYHYEQVTLYVPNVEEMRADSSWCRFKHIEELPLKGQ